MCSVSSIESDCGDFSDVGHALEKEAIQIVRAQLLMPGSSGRVWIEDWPTRYQPAFGRLRDFIERYPRMFKVIPRGDRLYVVELVELVDAASASANASTGTDVQNVEQELHHKQPYRAQKECWYFLRGCCRNGSSCPFAHNTDLKAQTPGHIVNLHGFASNVERFISDLSIDRNAAQQLRQQPVEKQRHILQTDFARVRNASAFVNSLCKSSCQWKKNSMFPCEKPSTVTPWKEQQTYTQSDFFKEDHQAGTSLSVQQSTWKSSKEDPQSRSRDSNLKTGVPAKISNDIVLLQASHPGNELLVEWLGNAKAASTAAKMIAVQSEDYFKAEEECHTSRVLSALLDSLAIQHPNMLFLEVQAKLVSIVCDGKTAHSRGEATQASICEVVTVYLQNVMIAASLHAALQQLHADKVQSAKNENFRRAHILKMVESQICSYSDTPLCDMASVVLPGISAHVSAAESTRKQAGQEGDTILEAALQGQIEILAGLLHIWQKFLTCANHADPRTLDCTTVSNAAQFGIALADFDGSAYGPEYLHLTKGMRLEIANGCEDDEGWIYGKNVDSSEQGWFPLSYWKSSTSNGAGELEKLPSETANSAQETATHATQVGDMAKLDFISGTWVGEDSAEYVVTLSSPFHGLCTKRTSRGTLRFPLYFNADCATWGKSGSYLLNLADVSKAVDSVLWRPRDAANKTFVWQRRPASSLAIVAQRTWQ